MRWLTRPKLKWPHKNKTYLTESFKDIHEEHYTFSREYFLCSHEFQKIVLISDRNLYFCKKYL